MSATLAREAVAGLGRSRVWASYARISSDRNGDGKGAGLGVARQHAQNREYVERVDPGASVIEFTDNGISGFLDVVRPEFDRMSAAVAAGEFAAVVAWHADRFSRQVGVTAAVVEACRRSGTELHTTLGGHHTDPTRLYIESVLAEAESRQKANRMLAKHAQLAESGGFQGGPRRYGYEPNMTAVRAGEAEIIRDLASRALVGESLSSLARSLDAAGVPTVSGGARWYPTVIRKILIAPHVAGLREHKGRTFAATWPAILDRATHDALVHRLTNPARATRAASNNAGKYLLSGLAVCGACGARVQGTWRGSANAHLYRCPCGITRNMADVDAWVTDHVIARLSEIDANGILTSDESNRRAGALAIERDALAGRREVNAAMFAAGDLDADGYRAAVAAITERETALAAETAALAETMATPHRVLDGVTGPSAASAWAALGDDTTGAGIARQRAIVGLLLDVTIRRVGRGARTFDPAGVDVQYRDLD